jgi:hypothetical protein
MSHLKASTARSIPLERFIGMATYLIGYDLHPKNGETYSGLIDAIKTLGNWWHHLDSTWVVVTNLNPVQIRDTLQRHLMPDDQLLVVQSARDAAWFGFTENGGQWLMSHL